MNDTATYLIQDFLRSARPNSSETSKHSGTPAKHSAQGWKIKTATGMVNLTKSLINKFNLENIKLVSGIDVLKCECLVSTNVSQTVPHEFTSLAFIWRPVEKFVCT